jgi:hypothetical protein
MIEWIKQQKQIFFQRNLSPMSQLHKSPEFIDLCRIDGVRGLSASHRAANPRKKRHHYGISCVLSRVESGAQ